MPHKNLLIISALIILAVVIIWFINLLPERYTAPVNSLMPDFLSEESPSAHQELPRNPITFTVAIKNNRFVPDRLEIKVNDSVRWVNEGETLHWVASDPHPTHTNEPGLDALGELQKGEFYIHQFKTPGIFSYHDHAAKLQELEAAQGIIIVK
ncbi:MAG: hypothetical protein HZB99_00170 [Candidatus Harrisonbacteria bacterium]|nr:hypothetical protein [Candidatus Harrisonbacteria bacterium]